MDKWFKDILPDKDPYHNRGRDQMRKKGVRNSSACVKYRSRPVHDMLKNILGYIHGKVRMLFTGIEICKNDIKCCIFVILCRYCRLIMFFFYLTKLELLYTKKNDDSV